MRYLFIALLVLASLAAFTDARCDFPAIFNFGASSSDTGGFAAAFPAQRPPYGMTYFGKPVGRASDGRLPIDFIGIYIYTILSYFKCLLVIYKCLIWISNELVYFLCVLLYSSRSWVAVLEPLS